MSVTNVTSPIQYIPQEVLIYVFGFLEAAQASTCSKVCKYWHKVIHNDLFWIQMLNRDFFELRTEGAKEAYQEHHLFKTNLCQGIYSSRNLTTEKGEVSSLIVEDGKLISCSYDKTLMNFHGMLKVWDLETFTCTGTLYGHTDIIRILTCKNGKVISGAGDKTIRIWDIKSNRCLATLQGHELDVTSLQVVGEKLYSASYDKTVRVWDLVKNTFEKKLQTYPSSIYSLIYIDGKMISGLSDGKIITCDLDTATLATNSNRHRGIVTAFVSNKDKFISGSHDRTIKCWDVKTNICTATLRGHGSIVSAMVFANERLFSGSYDKTIKCWNLTKNSCEWTLKGLTSPVVSMIFHEGKLIAGLTDGSIEIWDFRASHSKVLEELGELFLDPQDFPHALERFSRMPSNVRTKIYEQLDRILALSATIDKISSEDAFHNRNQAYSTPEQKVKAINNYLINENKIKS